MTADDDEASGQAGEGRRGDARRWVLDELRMPSEGFDGDLGREAGRNSILNLRLV